MTDRSRHAGPQRKEATKPRTIGQRGKARAAELPRKVPAAAGYHVWLVEQDLTQLYGEYLTETMVLARTEAEALEAACSLADPQLGFGLAVQRHRLRAVDYGPAPRPLPDVLPRHQHGDALVLVVGTGSGDGGSPDASGHDEDL